MKLLKIYISIFLFGFSALLVGREIKGAYKSWRGERGQCVAACYPAEAEFPWLADENVCTCSTQRFLKLKPEVK